METASSSTCSTAASASTPANAPKFPPNCDPGKALDELVKELTVQLSQNDEISKFRDELAKIMSTIPGAKAETDMCGSYSRHTCVAPLKNIDMYVLFDEKTNGHNRLEIIRDAVKKSSIGKDVTITIRCRAVEVKRKSAFLVAELCSVDVSSLF
jgi:hypothetical protein